MGICIINQTNEQECGVCVLTSLHNHFYKNNIVEKQQVLNEANIGCNGMSIFDFEVCSNKLGLECESYEVLWTEFLNLKINSYFVLLLSTNDNQTNHYVIAKKYKSHVEIYDSCSNRVNKIKYSDLQRKYLNILILVNKKPNKIFNNVFGKTKTLLMFDLKFVLLNILLSILILITSVISASYLNWIIDLSIQKNSITNLLTVSFVFIFIYFVNNLLTHINNLYCSGHLKSYFLLFTSKILTSLKNKKFSFLLKVDKNWIYKVDECVFNISNFCVVEINKFITNVLFTVICVCIVGVMQYYLLIFIVVIPLIQLIFFFFSYRKKKNIFTNIVRTENKNIDNYKRLILSLSNELWESKKENLINEIKSNYSTIYKNYHDVTLFKGNANIFKSLLRSLIEIVLIATMSYLIIKTKSLTIGKLTFLISTFGLYASSTNEIFNYFLSKIEFDVYWQTYKDLTLVDNLKQDKLISIHNEINKICFHYNQKEILIESKKDNFIKESAFELLSGSTAYYLNEQKADKNNSNVINNIIVCDENTNLDLNYFLKIFEQNPGIYAQYLRYFKIDLNMVNQSFYKKIILNLLCLISEDKKIIFLDSILDYLPNKDKLMVRDIVHKIQKNNSVFVLRKEEND